MTTKALTADLIRQPLNDYDDEGTYSEFVAWNGWRCAMVELPWRNNEHGVSCVPEGVYTLRWSLSPREGWCYHWLDVPDRDHILTHRANLAGDVSKGFVSQLLGCSAPGADKVLFSKGFEYQRGLFLPKDQHGVSASRTTLDVLQHQFSVEGKQQDILLTVRRAA